jgi:hypothetical protein
MKRWSLIVLLAGLAAASVSAAAVAAAEMPIREVVLYKHGVGFFARAGKIASGETVKLDFRSEDMNDVLKSLILSDLQGGKISGVRYDASEPLEQRLKDFPFAVNPNAPLSAFLDQMRGARIELKTGADAHAGVIVGARAVRTAEKERPAERESVTLLTDDGELRTIDLAAAGQLKFADRKMQDLLRDYLALIHQARSKDRRSVYIDATGPGAHELSASYMTPAPVWKSSYRLLFTPQGNLTLEGWAIIDNVSGEDWNGVRLSVVSGRPISFVTQLYPPAYVVRPEVELAENRAAAPRVFAGSLDAAAKASAPAPALSAASGAGAARAKRSGGPKEAADEDAVESAAVGEARQPRLVTTSTLAATAEGREAGALFEYGFSTPVTVKKGQSAMLPFLQQKVEGRKLLIYAESFGLNPQNAAEIVNSTGKTLDGGPITVYDGGAYGGEALVETVKAGDKRLISYGVDLGTRISTAWGSAKTTVREVHLRRGILTSRVATEETKNYTIRNVDAKAKTLVIEHAKRPAYTLLEPAKPWETAPGAYRFEVKVGASGSQSFAVREERVDQQTVAVSSMTPNVLASWLENKTLTAEATRQLEAIAKKKREIANNDGAIKQAEAGMAGLTQDQDRLRRNIESLRKVQGQDAQVQQYSRQLSANELKIVDLRNTESELRQRKAALEAELQGLIENAEF